MAKKRNMEAYRSVLLSDVKTSPPSFPKADAKVGLLRTSAKYIQAFFEGLRELFHNSLIDRYVLKHIF